MPGQIQRRLDRSLAGKASGWQSFRPAPEQGLLVAVTLMLFGCPAVSPPVPPAAAPKPVVQRSIAGLPVSLTVKQRSTTPIPTSLPPLSLTIADSTRGLVLITLADQDGKPVLASTSLDEGKSTRFTYGDNAYTLTLTRLDNALVGEDFASIKVDREATSTTAVPARTLLEKEKIQALIDHVAIQSGALFVRNGTKYSPDEAAKHLKQKWDAAGDQIQTAAQFIKEIASSSSISGEPYRIEWTDGKSAAAEAFLTDQLKQLESPEPPAATAPK